MNLNGNGQYDHDAPTPLRDLVQQLHIKFDEHAKQTARLNNIVFGDKEANVDGLVQKVEKHQKWITLDKKVKTFGAGLAASGGTGWAFWDSIRTFLKI